MGYNPGLTIISYKSFPSKSSPGKSYTTTVYEDYTTSCNCKGWANKKPGQARSCCHTKAVEADLQQKASLKPVPNFASSLAAKVQSESKPAIQTPKKLSLVGVGRKILWDLA